MVKEKHKHNLIAIYYRKKEEGASFQKWAKLEGYKVCNECLTIVKEEVKEIGN